MTITNDSYDVKTDVTMAAPANAVESGSGGGDMDVWGLSRENQLDELVAIGDGRTMIDQSTYGLPTGIAPGNYMTTTQEAESTPVAPVSDAEAGDGGGNMDVWGLSRTNQLDTLAVGIPVDDQSAFGFPTGIATGSYEGTTANAEYSMDQPQLEAGSGSGGGDMNIWSVDREIQLVSLLVSTPEGLTNASSYDFPTGIAPGSYENTIQAAEISMGTPTAGIEKGINVLDEVQLTGEVYLYYPDSPEDPNANNPIALEDATVTIAYVDDGNEVSDTRQTDTEGEYVANILNPPQDVTFTVSHPHVIQSVSLAFSIDSDATLDIPIPVYSVYEGAGVDQSYGGRGRSQKMTVGEGGIQYG